MTRKRGRLVVLPAVAMLVVAACGSDRTTSSEATSAPATAVATTAAPVATTASGGPATTAAPGGADDSVVETVKSQGRPDQFGDLDWPCGKGDGANADDGSVKGVTKDSVTIAIGDDAGSENSPGLNHEMTDAVKALVARCNELGGINGRKITTNYYDAKLLSIAQAIQAACDANNFFLVGEGWALDSGQEEIRHQCGLPAVPGYSVSAAFAMSADVYQGVPNPADELPAGTYAMIAKLFPEQVKAVITLGGNFSATQETIDKARVVAPEFGWSFVGDKLEYDVLTAVTDWTPFVKQIQAAGAKIVYWAGNCLPGLQKLAQTMKQNSVDALIVTDANHYTADCAAANTDGALDNMYIRFAYVPFEEAKDNKATQDYIDLVTGNGGDIALLGMQATSSFFLWATAAKECGATLTRECVLENMSKIHSWTAGGLHAETDPGGNHPPACNEVIKLEGTKYVRVAPTEPASFECDPKWIAKVTGVPALEPLKLDADRKSHQFDN